MENLARGGVLLTERHNVKRHARCVDALQKWRLPNMALAGVVAGSIEDALKCQESIKKTHCGGP